MPNRDDAKLIKATISRSTQKWKAENGRWVVRPDAKQGAPDYWGTGELILPGVSEPVKVTLSGWLRKGKQSGRVYLGLTVSYDNNEQRRVTLDGTIRAPAPDDNISDADMPF